MLQHVGRIPASHLLLKRLGLSAAEHVHPDEWQVRVTSSNRQTWSPPAVPGDSAAVELANLRQDSPGERV